MLLGNSLRSVLGRAAIMLFLVAGTFLLVAPSAGAHSLLLRAVPAADSTLASSPGSIVLTFTEPPDTNLSLIEVVDVRAHQVAGVSKTRPVAGDPAQLQVTLAEPLPTGIYTVNWRAVSSVDGHVSADSFAFGVGVAPPRSTAATGGFAGTSTWLGSASVAGKWLLFAGLALLLGAAATTLAVLRGPLLPAGGRNMLRLAWVLALAGYVVVVEAERASAGFHSLLPFFQSEEGWPVALLGIAVLAAGAALAALEVAPSRWTLAAVGAVAAAALFLHGMGGHANGPSHVRVLNLTVQWVHLVAAAVWIGGLAWLLLSVRGQSPAGRAAAVKRFSVLAGWALVLVAVSGVLRAVSEVGGVGSLVTTSFGVTLLAKVGLFLMLVPLGGLNRYRSLPALLGGAGEQRFRWTSRAELVVAAGILVLAGFLSGLAPANVAAAAVAAPAQVVVSGADYATTVRVHLTVTPGTVGANSFAAQVSDYASGKAATARSVQLEFSLPAQPSVGPSSLTMQRASDGSWRARGLELSVAGVWTCDVVIQKDAGAVVVPLTIRAALP
jgi:copper transport protein